MELNILHIQLFLQRQRKYVTLKNICTIMLEFKIKNASNSFDEDFDRFNSHALKIEPMSGYVNPESSVQIQVDHTAMTLGHIDHHFQLEVNDSSQFQFFYIISAIRCADYIFEQNILLVFCSIIKYYILKGYILVKSIKCVSKFYNWN